jgi:methylase of polypeptide subunit release factors
MYQRPAFFVDGHGSTSMRYPQPSVRQLARFIQRREHCLIRQLIPEPGVEALDERVLLRLSRRDLVPLDLVFLRPAQDRHAGELGPIIV